ncbi:hypothetical protein Pla8534_49340 [Lignipirellula cremea]|uniref:Uncharacterized protein n=2 Tax=Lignipirellula cremea TaxID=2528010 RepID=A0A518DZ42_9BACT|nr:hypothetical protein Pla8534_49340 [Lignipirellula cremea]
MQVDSVTRPMTRFPKVVRQIPRSQFTQQDMDLLNDHIGIIQRERPNQILIDWNQ